MKLSELSQPSRSKTLFLMPTLVANVSYYSLSLNLVILRVGFVYGPYTNFGESRSKPASCSNWLFTHFAVATLAIVSGVYGYLQRPMKSMYVVLVYPDIHRRNLHPPGGLQERTLHTQSTLKMLQLPPGRVLTGWPPVVERRPISWLEKLFPFTMKRARLKRLMVWFPTTRPS